MNLQLTTHNLQRNQKSKFKLNLFSNFLKAKNLKLKTNHGFTMIELLVVIAIFSVLSSLLVGNYHDFNTKASLDNLTHQVAILVRQAQVYGISVTQGNIYKGYGVYFSTATESDKKRFILFKDYFPKDNKYSSVGSICDGSDECVQKTTIQTGDLISLIKAKEKTDPANTLTLKELHIVFTRPNPEANLFGVGTDGSPNDKLADVEIYMKSPKGACSKVVVWSTGQVSVEQAIVSQCGT